MMLTQRRCWAHPPGRPIVAIDGITPSELRLTAMRFLSPGRLV